jgi:Lrp/AsnC family leucine-responsive transcriptional regulator
MDKRDMVILSYLRQNARETLTKMSRLTQIPVSTIFDKLRNIEDYVIKKHTTLLDFGKLGFSIRATLFISVKKEKKAETANFLLMHQNVNNLLKINNGYDFMIEVVFKSITELETFKEKIDEKFGIKTSETYFIIEDIKREAFMADPSIIDLVIEN